MKPFLASITLSFVLLVTSCGHYKQLPVSLEYRDSVSVTYRDSTVYHIDTLWVQLPEASAASVRPACDSSHLEIDVAISDAYVDSLGLLHHSLTGLPRKLPFAVPVPEHILTVDRAHASSEVVTVTKYVEKPLTRWQNFWIRAGIVLLAVFVLLIIARFFMK